MSLDEHFLFRPELRFSHKGKFLEMYSDVNGDFGLVRSETYKINYLELPLKLSVDFGKDDGFILTGGLYVAVGLFGNEKITYPSGESEKFKIDFSNEIDGTPGLELKPFESGWILGIGYKKNRILIDVTLNQSIASVHPEAEMIFITPRAGFVYYL